MPTTRPGRSHPFAALRTHPPVDCRRRRRPARARGVVHRPDGPFGSPQDIAFLRVRRMHVATVSQLTRPPDLHTHPTSPSPAMTRLPDTFGHYIDVYKQAREATTEYEFEQSEGGYLFASRDGRPFSVSSWTSVVKETFRRHSGLAPPPKLLRAIFIVWLRDEAHHNAATPDVLKSCAKLMKHQLATQESDVYDKKTHERLTKSAFDFTSAFADKCAKARREGKPMPSSSGGAAAVSSSSNSRSSNSSGSTSGGGSGRGGGGGRANRGGRGRGRGGRRRGGEGGRGATQAGRGRGRGRGRSRTPAASAGPPPPLAPPDVASLVGSTVRRIFEDGKMYEGVVAPFDGDFYTVEYTDGDKDDLTALELRFIGDGVYPGAKVQFHSGDGDGGWATGTIVEPYQPKHGRVWVPDDAMEPSRAELSWLVEFGNGWAPVDLRHERRVDEPADHPSGSWIALVDVTDEEAGGD
mmetsp:Transcript_71583/g.202260  ORF Transcript_71583/g.202260 Transcript_71583/m.202260 type:complete len:466 (-) Transcript_71583:398-1795(-)